MSGENRSDMKCCRDPYWDECDDAQKWKRMVSFVSRLERHIVELEDQMDAMLHHAHLNDKLVAPITVDTYHDRLPYKGTPPEFRTTKDHER